MEYDPYLHLGPLRWPPKVATSLELGSLAYFGNLIYLQGMTESEAANHVATGYTAFWTGVAGDTGLFVGYVVFLLALTWVFISRWRSTMGILGGI